MAPSTYETPHPEPRAGVPFNVTATTPTLFQPITFRGVTLPNRIMVAPMCMYSADNGHMTDFHLVHLGQLALRGASLTIIEATAVQPRGRISPGDVGLWEDSQIAPMKRVADFVHGQGHKIGIQLAHAGRKASTYAPWISEKVAGRGTALVCPNDDGGWTDDVWGPSELPYGPGCVDKVHAMTEDEIKQTIQDFVASAKRAVAAGIDVIEIHGAHGYLLSSFLSPLSNTRTDKYGGADSFDNRIRMLLETCLAIREVIPKEMPMFVRISATEWMDNKGWDVEDSIRLAKILAQPEYGVDLLDISSGGNSRDQKINMHNGFQVGIAGKIRASLHDEGLTGLAIGAVGLITAAKQAGEIVQIPTPPNEVDQGAACVNEKKALEVETEYGGTTQADVVLVARQFLKEPEWVLRVAHQLGVEVNWPVQYARARWSRNVILGDEKRANSNL